MTKLLLSVLLAANAMPAMADPLYAFVDKHRNEAATRAYVAGVGAGLQVGGVLSQSPQNQLYCPPLALAIQADQYLAIADDYVRKHGPQDPLGFPQVLAFGLRETFPCSR